MSQVNEIDSDSEHTTLKAYLKQGGFVTAPGVYDGLSALVADQAGFNALYLSGYAVSASLLGQPDAGYLTATHMADRVRTLCSVTDTPIIADADTGFGGLINVEAAVHAYEMAGASAIQFEDQEFPKRCGHTKNRKVVSLDEAAAKIKMAVDSRFSSEFLIIARTDARTSLGLDECFRRADAFLDAGADVLFIESPESPEEMRRIAQTYPEVPLVANMVEGGRTPMMTADELQQLGFNIAIYPLVGLSAAAQALRTSYRQLHDSTRLPDSTFTFSELNSLVGFDRVWALDDKYSQAE